MSTSEATHGTTPEDDDKPLPITDPTIYPGNPRSLSAIALHALILGLILSTCLISTVHLLYLSNPLWRLPQFLGTLSLFHFLEFWTTARYNTINAKVSSYLLTNGDAYSIAHTAATVEIIITSLFFPVWQQRFSNPWTITLGLVFVVMGQVVRSIAMAQAGTNFNHQVARAKVQGHRLVTSGVYSFSRHPSYFGYFFFAVGTQLVVGNLICGLVYLVVLWNFFSRRIASEERYLVEFFGKDYLRFKEGTGTGIPFIR